MPDAPDEPLMEAAPIAPPPPLPGACPTEIDAPATVDPWPPPPSALAPPLPASILALIAPEVPLPPIKLIWPPAPWPPQPPADVLVAF